MRIHCHAEFSAGLVYCHVKNMHPFAYSDLNRYFILVMFEWSKLFIREIKIWDTNWFMLSERENGDLHYSMFF